MKPDQKIIDKNREFRYWFKSLPQSDQDFVVNDLLTEFMYYSPAVFEREMKLFPEMKQQRFEHDEDAKR